MNLILFGFKGSGKTHFGKLLSLSLHRPFIDTDDLVVELYHKQTGQACKPRQLYEKLGKEGFRDLEKKAIELLKSVENSIISLGGATVLDPENVKALEKIGALIFLKADPEILKSRIFKEELPPFLEKSNPEQAFWQMIQERDPVYRSIKARCVDTSLLDEAGVVAALRSILLLEEPPNGF